MKITSVKTLEFPEIKTITFARFADDRGYFTELYRKSDIFSHPDLIFLKNIEFLQSNESFSKKGVIRGLHFQWDPYMGKLVRTISGHMIDMFLDIRKNSPYYGRIVCYDMPANNTGHGEWIWIPPGFAHGNIFLENTLIEYYCTGEYNPDCESGISPLSDDINWEMCDSELEKRFKEVVSGNLYISDKDRNAMSVSEWYRDVRSDKFVLNESGVTG